MRTFILSLSGILLMLLMAACSISDLSEIAPSQNDKYHFERDMKRALNRAVNTPGIDNGSTIILTAAGDTLVAPTDSTLRASDIRTVYVDLQPQYPHKVDRRTVQMIIVATCVGGIALIFLLILLGMFIIVVRRQHGRNKAINRAIDENYSLPEAFFTGSPAHAPVTINRIYESRTETGERIKIEVEEPASDGFTTPAYNDKEIASDLKTAARISKFERFLGSVGADGRRDLRNAFLFIGFGIVAFVTFVAVNEPGIAFFVGGCLLVLGLAKILSLYFSRRF